MQLHFLKKHAKILKKQKKYYSSLLCLEKSYKLCNKLDRIKNNYKILKNELEILLKAQGNFYFLFFFFHPKNPKHAYKKNI